MTSTIEMAVGARDLTEVIAKSGNRWMGGYGWGERRSVGSCAERPPLRAQCAVIRDANGPKVLVRVDILGFPPRIHHQIRSAVVSRGLVRKSSDFMLTASHTHSAPAMPDYPDPYLLLGVPSADEIEVFAQLLVSELIDLTQEVLAEEPRSVTLEYTEAVDDLAVNRESRPGKARDRVSILLARSATDGTPFAVLFGCACHPICVGQNHSWDSDFCGAASSAIERALEAPALFFQGCAGDLNPSGEMMANDARVGGLVLKAIASDGWTRVAGPVRTEQRSVDLPFVFGHPDMKSAFQTRVEDKALSEGTRRHAERMLSRMDQGPLDGTVEMPIQIWKLHGLTIVGLGHEVLSGYAERIRGFSSDPVWVMAYVNEVALYVPTDDDELASPFFEYSAGRKQADRWIAGAETNLVAYGWPLPLRTAAHAHGVNDPLTTQQVVLETCRAMLGP